MAFEETVFVTGFPGFIAARLIDRLAADGARLILLVQPDFVERAKQDLSRLSRDYDQFRIVVGDITQKDLGLSLEDQTLVRSEATVVFHLAAVYDLAVKRDLAMHVNLQGTKNVNDFVRSLPHLKRYHYVSTCYVAGKRKGVIRENELRADTEFRNYYEESKCLAELEVQALKSSLPVTIHRPAVVVGDSRTGETAKFDGIYYLINYLLRMPRFVSLLNIGNQKVSLNLVPVDFVVDAMVALAHDERSIGETVQIADPAPLSTHDLFNALAMQINGSGSRISLPKSWINLGLVLPLAPVLTRLPRNAVPYFFLRQTYDTSRLTALLAPHGVRCPPFPSYVGAIVNYAAKKMFPEKPGLMLSPPRSRSLGA